MRIITVTACSDLHRGPIWSRANDATPGWAARWAKVLEPKLRLGDMDELWQFTRQEIGELAGTDVAGNHDASGPCKCKEIRLGDTLFLHGHQFDPWLVRWIGRPVSRLTRYAEYVWPDIDVKVGGWLKRKVRAGRYGDAERYIEKAAAYAKKRGARQIVFGHLHQRFDISRDGVHVVCTGCCCNGRLDFVPVTVCILEGEDDGLEST